MLDLRREPVNGRVAGGQLAEGDPELQRLLEVSRPFTTGVRVNEVWNRREHPRRLDQPRDFGKILDRKSTRLNSSHVATSYAVFCLKKKNAERYRPLQAIDMRPTAREPARIFT